MFVEVKFHSEWHRAALRLPYARWVQVIPSSSRIAAHFRTHSLQIKTEEPAMSFSTSCFCFPQKEHWSGKPLSPVISIRSTASLICVAVGLGGFVILSNFLCDTDDN
jgi:hypothetical protein